MGHRSREFGWEGTTKVAMADRGGWVGCGYDADDANEAYIENLSLSEDDIPFLAEFINPVYLQPYLGLSATPQFPSYNLPSSSRGRNQSRCLISCFIHNGDLVPPFYLYQQRMVAPLI